MPIAQFSKFTPKDITVPKQYLEKMKENQARFVAGTYSSFRLVENQYLLNLIQCGIEIGSMFGQVDAKSVTFSRVCIQKEIFQQVDSIVECLKNTIKNTSHICIVSDIWSDSVTHNSYLDLSIFFVENFKLKHHLIGFK